MIRPHYALSLCYANQVLKELIPWNSIWCRHFVVFTAQPLLKYQIRCITTSCRSLGRTLSTKVNHLNPEIEPPQKRQEFLSQIANIPNILTFTRIATTPVVGYLIGTGQVRYALILFVYSCLTDFFDGYVARKFNMKSQIGSIIDPFADKFLMSICTVALAYSLAMPIAVAGVIFGRDVLLSAMSFFYRFQSLPQPRTLSRFFDISGTPTHTVHPSILGKINTALQMLYVGSLVMRPMLEFIFPLPWLMEGYLWLAGIVSTTTVVSGASYVSSKSFQKIIK